MRFVPSELQAKVDAGTATEHERAVHKLLAALSETDITPEQAAQVLHQASAVCDMKDKGHEENASAMLELFSTGCAEARLTESGYEFRLTEKGHAQAAALIRQIAGKKPN